ncbi:hypothetical protein B0H14DRAFT_3047610 [Mycena olivaceomarginata]|nr:hypothetical protein B0H14DRAFT_3047610 [Mycena olivaceomarginata]
MALPENDVGRDEFKQLCENASVAFPESPLHYKTFPQGQSAAKKEQNVVSLPKWPPRGQPRPSHEIYMNRLAPHEVLLENTYKAHKRTGTHYQYTRFHLRARYDLEGKFLRSPQFVRRIWIAHPDARRPVWIDHEKHTPILGLHDEVRLCQQSYANRPENRAVAKKLLVWAAAVVPHWIPEDDDVRKPQVTARAHAERTHHNIY